MSRSPGGFATFTVAAGEVVNLGKLIIIEVQAEPGSFMKHARYVYSGHVAPLKTDPRGALNKELAARLVDRPMTSNQSAPAAGRTRPHLRAETRRNRLRPWFRPSPQPASLPGSRNEKGRRPREPTL